MKREDRADAFSITYNRVVSLSHVVHSGIPNWPGDPEVEYETVARINDQGYYLRRFCLGEHSATHMNAPVSFHQHGLGIDGYRADSLVVPAVVVDVRDRAAGSPDYCLTGEDLQIWESKFGPVPTRSVVLLYTGWQARWERPEEFFNRDDAGRCHFPGFGLEAARFLLDQRQIAGLGIDTHGIDGGRDQTFAVNRLVLEQPRIVLENLANLDQLPPVGITLVIGVLPLKGGSGSPASVLALAT
jgi:kynurenine formamidase